MESAESGEFVKRIIKFRKDVFSELSKCIVGQTDVLEKFIIALLSKGHCILHGLPGLAKTLIVSSLARALKVDFQRIQFTPDLMPSDIIGSEIIEETETGSKAFKFIKGPIFSNIILADEINRTPPKTQAALLQAMQEYKVTVFGKTYELEYPFFVLATENPIELEGTYPLPEAQLDRFFFSIDIVYPSHEEEIRIASRSSFFDKDIIQPVIDKNELKAMQGFVADVPISEKLVEYIVNMVKATRPDSTHLKITKDFVRYGAGPRASQYLVTASKAHAALQGEYGVSTENIKSVAINILKHRIILGYGAYSSNITAENIIEDAIKYAEKML